MKIAINALSVQKRLWGGGRYTRSLVSEVSKLDQSAEFRVYASLSAAPNLSNRGPNVELVVGPGNRPLRIIWEQTGMPIDLARQGVDVFHGLGSVAPLWRVCPQVITIHDLTWFLSPQTHTRAKRHYFRTLIPLCVKRCDMIIASSEATRNDIIRLLHVPSQKVKVISLGVDKQYRPFTDSSGLGGRWNSLSQGRKIILFVGQIQPRKNLRCLIQAFAGLKDLHSGYCLFIAGSVGWNVEDVLRAPADMGIPRLVHFLGYVPEDQLPSLYNSAEMFVYPALYEGFGIPPLEAMACGVPTIASANSSMAEVVGNAGILVDPYSVDDIAAAILRIATDPNLRSRLRAEGLRRSRLFSWEKMALETLRVYYEVSGKPMPSTLAT